MNIDEQARFTLLYQKYLNELTLQGKQPKTIEHKKKISRSIEQWWEERKQQEINYGFNRQQTIK